MTWPAPGTPDDALATPGPFRPVAPQPLPTAPARRGPGLVVVLVVASVALLALAAGVTVWRGRGPVPRTPYTRVLVYGDSITEISGPSLHDRFDGSFTMTVSGRGGLRAGERVDDTATFAPEQPQQVIIELGTNDVLQGTSLDDAMNAITKIGTSFANARCVHLVNINEQMVSFTQPDVPQRAAELNRRMQAVATQHGWDVVAWNTIVDRYEASHEPDGPLTTDTVHPTAVGQQLLANAYGDVLDDCR